MSTAVKIDLNSESKPSAPEIDQFQIAPSDSSKTTPNEWPLLLKDYDQLLVKSSHYTPIPVGCNPLKRPIREYMRNGVLNIDKPSNPSSHEVVAWAKRILRVEKTGHSGTLDPKVTGNLLICIDRATRLVKSQQTAPKEYLCVIKLHKETSAEKLKKGLEKLTGRLFQRPPLICAVKRRLRIREVYWAKLLDFDEEENLGLFHVSCQAGSYIRTLCVHLGLVMGCGAHMQELRRVKTGDMDSTKNMVTMHDVLDAMWLYDNKNDESYLRRIIQPLEVLLVGYKKIVVKDTSVASVCFGAKMMLPGVLRFSRDIEADDDLVLITTKGEAIATATACMTSLQMTDCDHGLAAKLKRVIMEKEHYPRRWGLGPMALTKKKLVVDGKLSKHGQTNEETPDDWKQFYISLTSKMQQPPAEAKRVMKLSEGHTDLNDKKMKLN